MLFLVAYVPGVEFLVKSPHEQSHRQNARCCSDRRIDLRRSNQAALDCVTNDGQPYLSYISVFLMLK